MLVMVFLALVTQFDEKVLLEIVTSFSASGHVHLNTERLSHFYEKMHLWNSCLPLVPSLPFMGGCVLNLKRSEFLASVTS